MKLSELTKSLDRHRVRYILYSLKNGRTDMDGLKEVQEIKEHLSTQEHFQGWEQFSITWDVSPENPLKVIKRRFSVAQEWNSKLTRITK